MTIPADTLVCDTMQVAAWRQDGAFDYHRELVSAQDSLREWLLMKFYQLLGELFGSQAAEQVGRPLLFLLGAAVVAVIVWFVYKNHPELFTRRKKSSVATSPTEETIYGIDFDREIALATSRGDWRQAIRYTYLQTLRLLSDTGRIDWQPSKTPTQYVYEERHPAFRQLTTHFLRVRYGNYEASQSLYDEAALLAATLHEKGGAA